MPFGFSLNPLLILYTVIAAAGVAVMVWTYDAIGDKREARVWHQINAAIARKNVDVAKYNSLDDKLAGLEEATRIKALEEARQITVDQLAPKATEAQAKALSKIR
jgi:hypothetical protein